LNFQINKQTINDQRKINHHKQINEENKEYVKCFKTLKSPIKFKDSKNPNKIAIISLTNDASDKNDSPNRKGKLIKHKIENQNNTNTKKDIKIGRSPMNNMNKEKDSNEEIIDSHEINLRKILSFQIFDETNKDRFPIKNFHNSLNNDLFKKKTIKIKLNNTDNNKVQDDKKDLYQKTIHISLKADKEINKKNDCTSTFINTLNYFKNDADSLKKPVIKRKTDMTDSNQNKTYFDLINKLSNNNDDNNNHSENKETIHNIDNHNENKETIHNNDNHNENKETIHNIDNHNENKETIHNNDNHNENKETIHSDDQSNLNDILKTTTEKKDSSKVINTLMNQDSTNMISTSKRVTNADSNSFNFSKHFSISNNKTNPLQINTNSVSDFTSKMKIEFSQLNQSTNGLNVINTISNNLEKNSTNNQEETNNENSIKNSKFIDNKPESVAKNRKNIFLPKGFNNNTNNNLNKKNMPIKLININEFKKLEREELINEMKKLPFIKKKSMFSHFHLIQNNKEFELDENLDEFDKGEKIKSSNDSIKHHTQEYELKEKFLDKLFNKIANNRDFNNIKKDLEEYSDLFSNNTLKSELNNYKEK